MKARVVLCAACIGIMALSGCDDDQIVIPAPETVTVAFQDDVSPDPSYRGTRDAILKDGPANFFLNGNFGDVGSDTLGAVKLAAGFFERRFIIKMDLSSITDCSQVLEASLSIRVAPPAPDSIILEMHRVIRPDWNPWVEGLGGVANGVSWTTVDGDAPWDVAGGDIELAILDQETVSSDSIVTFSLPPLLVRNWIQHPESNHGVIIKGADVTRERYAVAYLRECSRHDRRPRLEVTYLRGG